MSADPWRNKIAAYADGELPAAETRVMAEHLRTCPLCTSDLLAHVQLKRAIRSAGTRYNPSLALRQRIQEEVEGRMRARTKPVRRWTWLPKLAAAAVLAGVVLMLIYGSSFYEERQTFSELADLHVATLASATPVDVISTDRHTVKPWFQGKLPFTFNLPELAGTPFTLLGGRVSYLGQAPGAQLIYQIGNHRISVFIFQSRLDRPSPSSEIPSNRLTFSIETFSANGLRYYIIGDAAAPDIQKLGDLLRTAARL
jgi:anti-sigma factor RsiW